MKRHLAWVFVAAIAVGCSSESEPNADTLLAEAEGINATVESATLPEVIDDTEAEGEPNGAEPENAVPENAAPMNVDPQPNPALEPQSALAADESVDLSSFYEGSESQRERLAELVGSQVPPSFELSNWMNSDSLSLADLKGKIVVIDFWATWCGPCIRAIPHNNEIARKYSDDVVLIGICHNRGGEKMEETATEKGIEYPIALDADNATIASYKVNGYPDYYVIDRDGKLRVADCRNGSVDDAIEALLAEGH